MSDVTRRCETCAHWAGGEEYSEALGVLGSCNATIETWVATDHDDDYNQFLKPEFKDTTAFAADGSAYSATLYTRPMHFCSMWKGKDADGVPWSDCSRCNRPDGSPCDNPPPDGCWVRDDAEAAHDAGVRANSETSSTTSQQRKGGANVDPA